MPVTVTSLLTLTDELAAIAREIREASDEDGDRGKRVTLAELGRILLAGGKLVAHVGSMIASGHHR